jgi:hypothetical protein
MTGLRICAGKGCVGGNREMRASSPDKMAAIRSPASIATAVSILLGNTSSAAPAQVGADREQHHTQVAPPPAAGSELAPADKGNSPSEMPKGGMFGDGTMDSGMMQLMQRCPMIGGKIGSGEAAAHSRRRIAFLKAELAITEAQTGVWDTYAAALRKNLEGKRSAREVRKKMIYAKSPVGRLELHVTAMESRVGALKEMKPALADLMPC